MRDSGQQYLRDDLLNGLGHWGEQAAGAAGTLISLLSRPGVNHGTVATVLGRIGPAATDVVPVLDRLAADADPQHLGVLVWARWRITGERTAATAATLAWLATVPPNGPESLRLLADLGPAAAAHESTIRSRSPTTTFGRKAEAAYALWRGTGDTTDSVPALLRILTDRTLGSALPTTCHDGLETDPDAVDGLGGGSGGLLVQNGIFVAMHGSSAITSTASSTVAVDPSANTSRTW